MDGFGYLALDQETYPGDLEGLSSVFEAEPRRDLAPEQQLQVAIDPANAVGGRMFIELAINQLAVSPLSHIDFGETNTYLSDVTADEPISVLPSAPVSTAPASALDAFPASVGLHHGPPVSLPAPSLPIAAADSQHQDSVRMSNSDTRTDTQRLAVAREEVNSRRLVERADRFIAMMTAAFPGPRMPWRMYLELSRELGCSLPEIDGFHLYLRERYAKAHKRRRPPAGKLAASRQGGAGLEAGSDVAEDGEAGAGGEEAVAGGQPLWYGRAVQPVPPGEAPVTADYGEAGLLAGVGAPGDGPEGDARGGWAWPAAGLVAEATAAGFGGHDGGAWEDEVSWFGWLADGGPAGGGGGA